MSRKRSYVPTRDQREEENRLLNARADQMMEKSRLRCTVYRDLREQGVPHARAKARADELVDGPQNPPPSVVQQALDSFPDEDGATSGDDSSSGAGEPSPTGAAAELGACPLCLHRLPVLHLPQHSAACREHLTALQALGFPEAQVMQALQDSCEGATLESLADVLVGG